MLMLYNKVKILWVLLKFLWQWPVALLLVILEATGLNLAAQTRPSWAVWILVVISAIELITLSYVYWKVFTQRFK